MTPATTPPTPALLNALMGARAGHPAGLRFPVFTRCRCILQHSHVKRSEAHPITSFPPFGPLWLIAPGSSITRFFFFRHRLWATLGALLEWGLAKGLFVRSCAAVKHDFSAFISNCWFAPALMVGVTLGLFFDYFPHRSIPSEAVAQRAVFHTQPLDELADHGAELPSPCTISGPRFPGFSINGPIWQTKH